MDWKVGQKLVCDRPEQYLTGCFVRAKEAGSVVVCCPAINLVVAGRQAQLEELGWRLEEVEQPEPNKQFCGCVTDSKVQQPGLRNRN